MNEDTLKILSAEHNKLKNCPCNYSEYLGWKNYKELPETWLSLGNLDFSEESIKRNGFKKYPEDSKNFTNYWSEQAVIAVNYYPYHECEYHQCSNCKAVFMAYVEHGGHAPQKRVKYVTSELIDGKY
jgi:hypothetical protein